MQKYEVKGHEPSFLPEGYHWKLAWSDEFDGTELDRSKWDFRLSMMGKYHPTWQEGGVTLDGDSHAVLTVFEKGGEICSPHLQTGYNYMDAVPDKAEDGLFWPIGKLKEHKFLHRYGYYECRCKLQKKPGWWTAFWVQSPVIGCCKDTAVAGIENDIMESFEPGKIIPHYNHHGGYGADHEHFICGKGAENLDLDAWHTFAMLWTENGYTFYIDGVEDGHWEGRASQIPQFILVSSEVNGYRTEAHAPTEEAKAAVGDTFVVDYVRVFDAVE